MSPSPGKPSILNPEARHRILPRHRSDARLESPRASSLGRGRARHRASLLAAYGDLLGGSRRVLDLPLQVAGELVVLGMTWVLGERAPLHRPHGDRLVIGSMVGRERVSQDHAQDQLAAVPVQPLPPLLEEPLAKMHLANTRAVGPATEALG